MRKIVAKSAPKPVSPNAVYVAWVYSAVIVVMVFLQLFAFEKFIPLLDQYDLWGGMDTATIAAALIVTVEVLALPFLLRMTLSPLMRWLSLVCSLAIAGAWLKLSLLALWTDNIVQNSGMFGSKLAFPAGWPAVLLSLILLFFAVYCVWGLWPLRKK